MNAAQATFILIYCLITRLPGPPEFKFENLHFQAYPIDRIKCPGIDPDKDIIFEFYSNKNPNEAIIIKINFPVPAEFDFSKPTIMFLHGFLESSNSRDAIEIRNAYLAKHNYNIILINAQRLTGGPSYRLTLRNVMPIAKYIAKLIDYLVGRGLNLSNLHLIGMSLGAQIIGIAGSLIKYGKASRITGLDPAGPIFSLLPEEFRLDQNDGEFVDIIHTDAGILGYPNKQGHADFWVNGGSAKQPGCHLHEISRRSSSLISERVFCSHWRSYQIYVASVYNPYLFKSTKCDNWLKFLSNHCEFNEKIYLGYSVPKWASGNYFLQTKHPFTQ